MQWQHMLGRHAQKGYELPSNCQVGAACQAVPGTLQRQCHTCELLAKLEASGPSSDGESPCQARSSSSSSSLPGRFVDTCRERSAPSQGSPDPTTTVLLALESMCGVAAVGGSSTTGTPKAAFGITSVFTPGAVGVTVVSGGLPGRAPGPSGVSDATEPVGGPGVAGVMGAVPVAAVVEPSLLLMWIEGVSRPQASLMLGITAGGGTEGRVTARGYDQGAALTPTS
jgi:hypothetical protein